MAERSGVGADVDEPGSGQIGCQLADLIGSQAVSGVPARARMNKAVTAR
ncbi:MAG TPA: hypothetical protein VED59_09220 [Acidimicrobiales bacterium]|nr:hypothetical protein [Acidimicrobiales bacterium]